MEKDYESGRMKSVLGGDSSVEFCLNNFMCYSIDEVVITDALQKVCVPVCVIDNDCRYHGQVVASGRCICDYLLREANEKKKDAFYGRGGKDV